MAVNDKQALSGNTVMDESLVSHDQHVPAFANISLNGYEVEIVADKRGLLDPIPANMEKTLSRVQMISLLKLENIGWRLCFVRRSVDQSALPVLFNPANDHKIIISCDGELTMKHGMKFRTN